MTVRPIVLPKSAKKSTARTADPLDIAARYLVYKLYVSGKALADSWQPLSALGETVVTARRAVELGWVILRDEGQGKTKERCAVLTEEGRVLARQSGR